MSIVEYVCRNVCQPILFLILARWAAGCGPQLTSPRVDTLNGFRHANMRALRFDADDGVWRVAFAGDPIVSAALRLALALCN